MADERHAIALEEPGPFLARSFSEGRDEPLHDVLSEEKRKLVILMQQPMRFERSRRDLDPEVNLVLKAA